MDIMEQMMRAYRGYEKVKLYAWMRSDGTILSLPDTDLARLLTQQEELQEIANGTGYNVRLCRYKLDRTEKLLRRPPDPDDNHRVGGSAIGGHYCSTLVHVQEELEHLFGKLYKGEVAYNIKDDVLTAEGGNVRVTVQLLPKEKSEVHAEYNLPMVWRVMLTMIKNWNSDYHDQHLGDYYSGSIAADKAFLGFLRFQVDEAGLDWI